MNPGQHIPKDKRDDMAKVAFAIAADFPKAQAIKEIASGFKVSASTARNLLSRGKFLCGVDVKREGKAA